MLPRVLTRITEWVKAHQQFRFEFEERGSRTWIFLRTWLTEDFYRLAVGVVDRYFVNASSKLVTLDKFSLLLLVGHLSGHFLRGHTPWLSAIRSTLRADTRKLSLITPPFMCASSDAVCRRLRQFSWDPGQLLDDWIFGDTIEKCWAS